MDDSFAMVELIYDLGATSPVYIVHDSEHSRWCQVVCRRSDQLTTSPVPCDTNISNFMFIVHVTNGQLMLVTIFQCVPVHIFVWLHHH